MEVEPLVKLPRPAVSLLGTGKLSVVIKLPDPKKVIREEGGQKQITSEQ